MLKYTVFWVIYTCFVLMASENSLKDDGYLTGRPSDATDRESPISDGTASPPLLPTTEVQQSTPLITRIEIQNWVNQNNVLELIKVYNELIISTNFNPELFYPTEYIVQNYERSFDRLNDAAKFCILIVATCGDKTSQKTTQISREIIANAFPFKEKDRDAEEKLRASNSLTDAQRMQRILETPFSFNYQPNIQLFNTEQGKIYLKTNLSSTNPIILFNTGCISCSLGLWKQAYNFFMAAGENGITGGFVEATDLIVKDKVNHNQIKTKETEIKEILEKAGTEGQWQLITCYRYRFIKDEKINCYNAYFDIIERNEVLKPSYFFDLGVLSFDMAKGIKDTDPNKIILLETALSCLLDAMDSGAHSAYKETREIQQELLRLKKYQSIQPKIIEEAEDKIQKHSSILKELSIIEINLIRQLLSE